MFVHIQRERKRRKRRKRSGDTPFSLSYASIQVMDDPTHQSHLSHLSPCNSSLLEMTFWNNGWQTTQGHTRWGEEKWNVSVVTAVPQIKSILSQLGCTNLTKQASCTQVIKLRVWTRLISRVHAKKWVLEQQTHGGTVGGARPPQIRRHLRLISASLLWSINSLVMIDLMLKCGGLMFLYDYRHDILMIFC